MPPISVLMKPSSGNCDMKCDYCFYHDETVKRKCVSYGLMTEDTLKNIIRKTLLRAEGSITYAYQGGEPTLRGIEFYREAIRLQGKYNKNGVRVFNALQTNGFSLNEEWCAFFKENDFLIGVSLDGTRDIHNLYRHDKRGNDTFDRVMQSIALLERYNVEYNILTVVNGTVAKNIKQIYEFYESKGLDFQQYIACLDPLGEERGKGQYALLPMEYGSFLTELFDMWYKDWERGRQPFIRQFENYIRILAGYIPEACEQRGICGKQYVVEADGSVYPCDFYMLDEYRLGNFNKHRLEEIDIKREEIGFVKESEKLSDECKCCKYNKLCRGGCRRNRDYDKQQDSYQNYFCDGLKYFFDNTIERMQIVADSVK